MYANRKMELNRIVGALEEALRPLHTYGLRVEVSARQDEFMGGLVSVVVRDGYASEMIGEVVSAVNVVVNFKEPQMGELICEAIEACVMADFKAWQVRNRYDLEWL